MNQLLGEEHAPRLRDCDGRGAEVSFKKPAQLAFSHRRHESQGPRQFRPLDQESLRRSAPTLARRYSRCRANRPVQERSRAGSEGTHESRPPARQRRRRRSAVLPLGRTRRTDRTAVDPGGRDPDEQATIKTRIARLQRSVTDIRGQALSYPRLCPIQRRSSRHFRTLTMIVKQILHWILTCTSDISR